MKELAGRSSAADRATADARAAAYARATAYARNGWIRAAADRPARR